NEKGNALNAHGVSLALEAAHGLEALCTRKRPAGAARFKAGRGGDPCQHVGAADVKALLKIAGEQAVHDRFLPALLVRLPDQAVCEPRVGCALHALELERDADLAAGGQHARVKLGASCRAELAGPIDLAFDAFSRHVRVELKGTPREAD